MERRRRRRRRRRSTTVSLNAIFVKCGNLRGGTHPVAKRPPELVLRRGSLHERLRAVRHRGGLPRSRRLLRRHRHDARGAERSARARPVTRRLFTRFSPSRIGVRSFFTDFLHSSFTRPSVSTFDRVPFQLTDELFCVDRNRNRSGRPPTSAAISPSPGGGAHFALRRRRRGRARETKQRRERARGDGGMSLASLAPRARVAAAPRRPRRAGDDIGRRASSVSSRGPRCRASARARASSSSSSSSSSPSPSSSCSSSVAVGS